MPSPYWLLTDSASGVCLDSLEVGPRDVPGALAGFYVRKRRLRGGLSDGVDVIEIHSGGAAVTVVPTRGMGIARVVAGELNVGWQSPIRGPVHPAFVDLGEPSGLGFLDGFDELLVRCGLQSNGAPEHDAGGKLLCPLHGRIANRPAHRVHLAIEGDEIVLTGVVEESRFLFTRLRLTATLRMRFGEEGFRLRDEVENLSAQPAGMQMLYHINFGRPLLEAGSQVVAPVRTLVPRNAHSAAAVNAWNHYAPPVAGFAEQVYFFDLLGRGDGSTQVLLANAPATRGVSLKFNRRELPCFTLWKNTGALEDGYVTGLEPATNYPNPRSFEAEQGRVVQLAPGGKHTMDLGLEIHANDREVATASQAIAEIQGGTRPTIHSGPQAGWCAM
jgi:hypothetical protein